MYQLILDKHHLLKLDEATHTYTLQDSDIEFSSVTEFISTFFTPFNEVEIAKKLTRHPKYQNKNINDILKDWEQRRNRGTIVHKEIEDFIKQMSNNDSTIMTEGLDLKSKQGIDFLKTSYYAKPDKKKNNLIFPEIKVFSEKLKLAGTIDLLIYNKEKNQISLIDWKTNQNIKQKDQAYKYGLQGTPAQKIYDCNFEKYSLQLSMYRYILEKFYNASVSGLYILHLKEMEFKVMPCVFQSNHIINMLMHTQKI